MMDWKKFWKEYPKKNDNLDLFQQVGKTKYGKAISEEQFEMLVGGVVKQLRVTENDTVLDLCCGNGLITNEIAKIAKKVVGIDYSEFLIEQANKTKQKNNIEYIFYDVKSLKDLKNELNDKFTKVLCYEALGYLNEKEFSDLLDSLIVLSEANSLMLFGSILDRAKIFNFFNTFYRKLLYLKLVFTRKDFGLGKWWKMEKIQSICKRKGLGCDIFEQNRILHTAHFRTDVLISNK